MSALAHERETRYAAMMYQDGVNWRIGAPIRALTVGVTKLVPADEVVEQVSLFEAPRSTREKQEKLEVLVDQLREKHGEASITLGYQGNKGIGVIRGEGKR